MSLCRQRKFNTSSANPKKIMQQIDNNPAINLTNYRNRLICIQFDRCEVRTVSCGKVLGSLIESNQNGINAKGMKINIAVKYTRPEITPKLSGLIFQLKSEIQSSRSYVHFFFGRLVEINSKHAGVEKERERRGNQFECRIERNG